MIHVHGWDISQQMVMTGAVVGLSYSAIAAGLILVYRANGIINFAVVAFGAVALGAFGVLTEHGWGLWPCLLVAVPVAALAAMLLEVVVIRRLADAPRLVLLMATIGIAQLLGFAVLVFAELLPDVPPGGDFPTLVPRDWSWQVTKDLLIGAREISVLIAVPILVILLALFMTRTRLGLMVRAAASNSEKSRLMGIPVARTSTVVWGIAAAFTAVTIIVLASVQFVTPLGAANGTAQLTLGYPVLVKALLIAMIARMRILWLTIPIGIALGIIEVIFQQNVTGIDANVFALWLFVATLVVVLTLPRSMRVVTETGNSWKLAGRVKPLPERLRDIWVMRQLPRLGVVAALLVFAVIPAFAPQASQSFLWTRVVIFAIAGCSLTILSGWAGQLSLGQFGFSAIGGLVTVKMVTSGWFGVHNVPWGVAVDPRRAGGRGGRGADRHPRAPHPRPVPRGHDPRVRGVRGELARDPPLARHRRVHRIDPGAPTARHRDRQLLVAALLLLPVPVLPRACASRSSRRSGDRASGARSSRSATTNVRPRR